MIATGVSHSVRELVETGVRPRRASTGSSYVRLDPALLRPAEVDHLIGDAVEGAHVLGWTAARSISRAGRHDGRCRSRTTSRPRGGTSTGAGCDIVGWQIPTPLPVAPPRFLADPPPPPPPAAGDDRVRDRRMQVTETKLEGVVVIEPTRHADNWGSRRGVSAHTLPGSRARRRDGAGQPFAVGLRRVARVALSGHDRTDGEARALHAGPDPRCGGGFARGLFIVRSMAGL